MCVHIIFVTFKGSIKDKEIFLRSINENINVVSSFLSDLSDWVWLRPMVGINCHHPLKAALFKTV